METHVDPGFFCEHCTQWVPIYTAMGTHHRNHCPFCLWSKHVDGSRPGDRISPCQLPMEPVGLTFKHEGYDKYGKKREGEIMVIHACTGCDAVIINRIAADDETAVILSLLDLPIDATLEKRIRTAGIDRLDISARPSVEKQLFGDPAKIYQ